MANKALHDAYIIYELGLAKRDLWGLGAEWDGGDHFGKLIACYNKP